MKLIFLISGEKYFDCDFYVFSEFDFNRVKLIDSLFNKQL